MGAVQTPWHFTNVFLDLFDHWQTLEAGLLAFVAGLLAFVAAVIALRFERRKERLENRAILVSRLEIPPLLSTVFETHGVFEKLTRAKVQITARDLMKLTELRQPVAYPAAADKLGRLGPQLAGGVSTSTQILSTSNMLGE